MLLKFVLSNSERMWDLFGQILLKNDHIAETFICWKAYKKGLKKLFDKN